MLPPCARPLWSNGRPGGYLGRRASGTLSRFRPGGLPAAGSIAFALQPEVFGGWRPATVLLPHTPCAGSAQSLPPSTAITPPTRGPAPIQVDARRLLAADLVRTLGIGQVWNASCTRNHRRRRGEEDESGGHGSDRRAPTGCATQARSGHRGAAVELCSMEGLIFGPPGSGGVGSACSADAIRANHNGLITSSSSRSIEGS